MKIDDQISIQMLLFPPHISYEPRAVTSHETSTRSKVIFGQFLSLVTSGTEIEKVKPKRIPVCDITLYFKCTQKTY